MPWTAFNLFGDEEDRHYQVYGGGGSVQAGGHRSTMRPKKCRYQGKTVEQGDGSELEARTVSPSIR